MAIGILGMFLLTGLTPVLAVGMNAGEDNEGIQALEKQNPVYDKPGTRYTREENVIIKEVIN